MIERSVRYSKTILVGRSISYDRREVHSKDGENVGKKGVLCGELCM